MIASGTGMSDMTGLGKDIPVRLISSKSLVLRSSAGLGFSVRSFQICGMFMVQEAASTFGQGIRRDALCQGLPLTEAEKAVRTTHPHRFYVCAHLHR